MMKNYLYGPKAKQSMSMSMSMSMSTTQKHLARQRKKEKKRKEKKRKNKIRETRKIKTKVPSGTSDGLPWDSEMMSYELAVNPPFGFMALILH